MGLISLIIVLLIIGVGLWGINKYGAPYIDSKILVLINIVAVVVTVIWLLTAVFPGVLGAGNIKIGE